MEALEGLGRQGFGLTGSRGRDVQHIRTEISRSGDAASKQASTWLADGTRVPAGRNNVYVVRWALRGNVRRRKCGGQKLVQSSCNNKCASGAERSPAWSRTGRARIDGNGRGKFNKQAKQRAIRRQTFRWARDGE